MLLTWFALTASTAVLGAMPHALRVRSRSGFAPDAGSASFAATDPSSPAERRQLGRDVGACALLPVVEFERRRKQVGTVQEGVQHR